MNSRAAIWLTQAPVGTISNIIHFCLCKLNIYIVLELVYTLLNAHSIIDGLCRTDITRNIEMLNLIKKSLSSIHIILQNFQISILFQLSQAIINMHNSDEHFLNEHQNCVDICFCKLSGYILLQIAQTVEYILSINLDKIDITIIDIYEIQSNLHLLNIPVLLQLTLIAVITQDNEDIAWMKCIQTDMPKIKYIYTTHLCNEQSCLCKLHTSTLIKLAYLISNMHINNVNIFCNIPSCFCKIQTQSIILHALAFANKQTDITQIPIQNIPELNLLINDQSSKKESDQKYSWQNNDKWEWSYSANNWKWSYSANDWEWSY